MTTSNPYSPIYSQLIFVMKRSTPLPQVASSKLVVVVVLVDIVICYAFRFLCSLSLSVSLPPTFLVDE